MNIHLPLLVIVTLATSECAAPPVDTEIKKSSAQEHNRIQVQRIGVFDDGIAYQGKRGIYLIRDTKTGSEFVGVSGIGITESGSHKSGKTTIQDER